jgi:predicted dienelactone hydrolase
MIKLAALIFAVLAFPANAQQNVPGRPGIDAPELAVLGPYTVGFRAATFVNRNQPDLENVEPLRGAVNLTERTLQVDIWYPARVAKGTKTVIYRGSLWAEPPGRPISFSQAGMAVANAEPVGRGHPLVVVSHGYSNNPAVMTWLTENLASKGYVVAAIHHRDPNPYIVSSTTRAAPDFHRPVDIAFVTTELRKTLGAQIDPSRIALIGYSQGGYGVLTAGGATLDPDGPNMALVADGWLKRFARGGARTDAIKVHGLKAIVALAPGGGLPRSAWGSEGLAAITAPLLLIHGDSDPVVDYTTGALAVFGGAVNADRYLLTYKQAGHSIALNPAPTEMRGSLWDIDWFEDPIWRQDRINAINLHFITAFLAVHLRDESDKRSFLNVPVEQSDAGEWAAPDGTSWGAYSPGGDGVTLWKGFQRRHARGMILQHRKAAN